MKKIYVTIEEFLDNGGVLLEDRDLFTDNGKIIGNYLGYDSKQNMHLMYNSRFKSAPLCVLFYVEVEAKPIYK